MEEKSNKYKMLLALQPFKTQAYIGYKRRDFSFTHSMGTLVEVSSCQAMFEVEGVCVWADHDDIEVRLMPIKYMSDQELSRLCSDTSLDVCVDLANNNVYFRNQADNTLHNWKKVINWLDYNHYDTNGYITEGLAEADYLY